MKKVPKYLFSAKSNYWNKAAQRIRSASGIALFLDYDGTVTPIRNLPSLALLSSEAEQLLRKLSLLPLVRVSVVTGRAMENIRKLIPLENIGFASDHGFQIVRHDGTAWIHPHAVISLPILQELRQLLHRALKNFPKSFIEDKHLTLSIHYRNVERSKISALKTVVKKIARPYATILKITQGKKVIELRPMVTWGKMNAVLELEKTFPCSNRPLSVFIGDDATDEDVFRGIKKSGITIRVGKSSKTAAQYYVRNVDDVLLLLKLIIRIRSQSFHS